MRHQSRNVSMYVAYCNECLRDGNEECARLFDTKEQALAWIEKLANGFNGENCDFALFELGKQIPLEQSVEMEEPKPQIKRRVFKEKR